MNTLKVVGSGSNGNLYLLNCADETLIIEQGLSFRDMKIARGFALGGIVGGICSHTHSDHNKYTRDFERAGIPIYKPFDSDERKVKFGGFSIQAFEVPHTDDLHCYGFYIQHEEIGKLLFLTDLRYCPFDFSRLGVNHIMVECNYCESLLPEEITNLHKITGHLALGTCKEFVRINASDALRTVTIIHIGEFSDEAEIEREIKAVAKNADVRIAKKNLIINLNKTEE